MTINEKAYAKLNISLDILSRLPDGYHAMLMIMQSVSLCDELTLQPDEQLSVCTNVKYLPSDSKNIAIKAAASFFEYTGIQGGVHIDIKKRIPVCSGMGGGSADAAAVLRGLNRLYDAKLTRTELEEIGFRCGADVPFCIAGGTSLARGKGELLSKLPDFPDCSFVICKPSLSISTPELFARIKCDRIRRRPDTEGIIRELEAGNTEQIARRMYNVFEDVLPPNASEICTIRDELIQQGACGSVMTGTGSAVFGIFLTQSDTENAKAALSELCPFCCTAKPVGVYCE